jgi:hypothetical protein
MGWPILPFPLGRAQHSTPFRQNPHGPRHVALLPPCSAPSRARTGPSAAPHGAAAPSPSRVTALSWHLPSPSISAADRAAHRFSFPSLARPSWPSCRSFPHAASAGQSLLHAESSSSPSPNGVTGLSAAPLRWVPDQNRIAAPPPSATPSAELSCLPPWADGCRPAPLPHAAPPTIFTARAPCKHSDRRCQSAANLLGRAISLSDVRDVPSRLRRPPTVKSPSCCSSPRRAAARSYRSCLAAPFLLVWTHSHFISLSRCMRATAAHGRRSGRKLLLFSSLYLSILHFWKFITNKIQLRKIWNKFGWIPLI